MKLITYPARPTDGGKLEKARRKFGAWAWEPKYNGWRALLHLPSGEMWNRHGELLTVRDAFGTAIGRLQANFRSIPSIAWLDVEALDRRHECMRGTLIVLDMIGALDLLPNGGTYEQRRRELERWLPQFGLATTPQVCSEFLTPSIPGMNGVGEALYAMLQDENDRLTPDWRKRPLNCFYEGVVAKRTDSLYPVQLLSQTKPFSGWMKHRFA